MKKPDTLVSERGIEYHKVKPLGQGQSSKVYKVVDSQGNFFALKEFNFNHMSLSEKQKNAIKEEIRIMKDIQHPRILRLYDRIITPKGLSIVTTFCDGGDLESKLLRERNNVGFGEQIALAILREIGEAFFELRSKHVIHRDLKLANIFLKEGHVVIGDFGFAKMGVSITESKLGTPYYMAPEILFNQQKTYDSRCDLWSIGVCFYLLIFGQLPFDAGNIPELIDKIGKNAGNRLRFPTHQNVSGSTRQVLMRLLQVLPQDRMSFVDFFRFCGIQMSDADVQQLNSSQSVYQTYEADDMLRASQIQNFGGVGPAQSRPTLPLPDSPPTKTTPNLELLNSATSLQNFKTLVGDPTYGFFLLAFDADAQLALLYLNEINKLIFNMRTVQSLAELRNARAEAILAGEVNVTCLLLEIFATRKTEIMTEELKSALNSRHNVFQIANFPQVISSPVYTELLNSMSLFQQQVLHLFQIQQLRFQQENPAFQADFTLYRQMGISQVETAAKKLTVKLIETYKEKHASYAEPGRTLFLKLIIHCCYFSKVLPLPRVTQNPREWVVFYDKIYTLGADKMHPYIMDLKAK